MKSLGDYEPLPPREPNAPLPDYQFNRFVRNTVRTLFKAIHASEQELDATLRSFNGDGWSLAIAAMVLERCGGRYSDPHALIVERYLADNAVGMELYLLFFDSWRYERAQTIVCAMPR